MTPSTHGRPSDPHLPGDGTGGPAFPDPERDRAQDPEPDPESVARKILLDQLTGQARSRAELETRLARKGVPDEVAHRLLDRFEEVGLVDDEAFARAWVQSRQSGKGLARRALAQELRRKGVDDDTARVALDEVDPDDEVEAARTLVRRKLRSVQRHGRDAAARRLTGMLARKGYPAGLCYRVVREELEAAGFD
ncbi:MAG: regulatory protein RecX, partial [Nocardioidaceae bacterium]|nr:regulatory protein RecX [Nocardioidaceae bacterium]